MTERSVQPVRPGSVESKEIFSVAGECDGQVDAEDEVDPDEDAEEQWHLFGEGGGGEAVDPDRPGDWVMTSGNRPDVGADAEDHWGIYRLQQNDSDEDWEHIFVMKLEEEDRRVKAKLIKSLKVS